jgi:hypothetical protein
MRAIVAFGNCAPATPPPTGRLPVLLRAFKASDFPNACGPLCKRGGAVVYRIQDLRQNLEVAGDKSTQRIYSELGEYASGGIHEDILDLRAFSGPFARRIFIQFPIRWQQTRPGPQHEHCGDGLQSDTRQNPRKQQRHAATGICLRHCNLFRIAARFAEAWIQL